MIFLSIVGGITCLLVLAWLAKELAPYHSGYGCGYTNSFDAPTYICLNCKIHRWVNK